MAVVGFDTSTDDTSVAATRDGEVLYEALLGPAEKGGPLHATALLVEVERAVTAAGGWGAVESIAVGLGPGSFTGLRVGVATARGLGLSCRLPVTGVSSLDAIGRALGRREASRPARLAAIDARRGEVFAALYGQGGERLWGPLVCAPEELAERLASAGEPVLGAGSGAVRFRDELTTRGVEVPDEADPIHRIAAPDVCALAALEVPGAVRDPRTPIYLRAPDAERWRERRTIQTAD